VGERNAHKTGEAPGQYLGSAPAPEEKIGIKRILERELECKDQEDGIQKYLARPGRLKPGCKKRAWSGRVFIRRKEKRSWGKFGLRIGG